MLLALLQDSITADVGVIAAFAYFMRHQPTNFQIRAATPRQLFYAMAGRQPIPQARGTPRNIGQANEIVRSLPLFHSAAGRSLSPPLIRILFAPQAFSLHNSVSSGRHYRDRSGARRRQAHSISAPPAAAIHIAIYWAPALHLGSRAGLAPFGRASGIGPARASPSAQPGSATGAGGQPGHRAAFIAGTFSRRRARPRARRHRGPGARAGPPGIPATPARQAGRACFRASSVAARRGRPGYLIQHHAPAFPFLLPDSLPFLLIIGGQDDSNRFQVLLPIPHLPGRAIPGPGRHPAASGRLGRHRAPPRASIWGHHRRDRPGAWAPGIGRIPAGHGLAG